MSTAYPITNNKIATSNFCFDSEAQKRGVAFPIQSGTVPLNSRLESPTWPPGATKQSPRNNGLQGTKKKIYGIKLSVWLYFSQSNCQNDHYHT